MGYAPQVNFEEGLRRTVAWYRQMEERQASKALHL
jgi:dTDP-D-glucose 4,6-dehydratase